MSQVFKVYKDIKRCRIYLYNVRQEKERKEDNFREDVILTECLLSA